MIDTFVTLATCPVCGEGFNIEGRTKRIFHSDKCSDRASNALLTLRRTYRDEMSYLKMTVKRNHFGGLLVNIKNPQITPLICVQSGVYDLILYAEMTYGNDPRFTSHTVNLLLELATFLIAYEKLSGSPVSQTQLRIFFGQGMKKYLATYHIDRSTIVDSPCQSKQPF